MSSWRASAKSFKHALPTLLVWAGLILLSWAAVIGLATIALMIFR